jgi:putative oxidoreductase
MFDKLIRTDKDQTTIILRLALGIVMFPHGAQKLLGWYGGYGFSATMDWFTGIGIPAVIAFLVILGEFFGALGLIFGFLSRLAATGIALIMLGAVIMVHSEHGFFMNWSGSQAGEGYEFHILAIGIAIAIAIRGSGALSIDRMLMKKR